MEICKPLSDTALITLFLHRDNTAISILERRYGAYMHDIAYNILKNAEDSEECCNDAYLSVWNHIPPDMPNSLKAYLAAIIRHIALDRYKEKGRKKRIPSEYMMNLDDLSPYIGGENDVENEMDSQYLQQVFNRFVKQLKEKEQYIFVSKYYYCDTVKTIAAALKISESSVTKTLSRIKKNLQNLLKKEGIWE